jgi:hypothetical protein
MTLQYSLMTTNSVYPLQHSLMMETENVSKTLDFCFKLMQLIAWEDFIGSQLSLKIFTWQKMEYIQG